MIIRSCPFFSSRVWHPSLCTPCRWGFPLYLLPADTTPKHTLRVCSPAPGRLPKSPLQEGNQTLKKSKLNVRLAMLEKMRGEIYFSCRYLTPGELILRLWLCCRGGRGSLMRGRTASSCRGGPERDQRRGGRRSARLGETRRRLRSAC